MNKRNLLRIVNILLAVLILNQATTGLIHSILSRDAFEFLHEGGGIAIFIAALVHVYLNWAWVKANILPGRKK